MIWSTWFIQQMVTFYASFWQVLLQSSNFFFFTFMKYFLQLYENKIQIFAIISTTKSSIKVKILIWSTWVFQQMVTFLCILLTRPLAKLKLYFLHFYNAFFTAIQEGIFNKWSHFMPHSDKAFCKAQTFLCTFIKHF